MLILYPRLSNGNVLWSCDKCNDTTEVSCGSTNAVALVCMCDRKVHPHCNKKWYYEGLFNSRLRR